MKKQNSLSCIDIGTHGIKFVSGTWASDGKIHLQQIEHHIFSTGAFQKHGIETLFENLTDFLSKHKITSSRIIISLHNPQTGLQNLSLPEMPKEEFFEAIKIELIQKKKFSQNTSEFDFIFTPLSYDPTASNNKIFVNLEKKDFINKLIDIFSNHKNKLYALEYPNFALINALKKFGTFTTNKAYLVLHFGASFVYFIIIHNFKMVFERRLNMGGDALTKTIADYCKIDFEQAEKIKIENGITTMVMSDTIIEANHILTSSLEKLVSDIQYSIKYFSFQVTKSKITTFEKLILTGSGANLPGLKDFISERLSIESYLVDFKDKVKLPKDIPFEKDVNIWPVLTTALGLGFWNPDDINVDCSSILPANMGAKESSKPLSQHLKTGINSTIVLITFFISLLSGGLIYLKSMDARINTIKSSISETETILKRKELDIETAKNRYIELSNKKRLLETKRDQNMAKFNAININRLKGHSLFELLESVAQSTPADLYIQDIQIHENIIQIQGITKSHAIIAELMKKLNASTYFRNANFLYTKINEKPKNIEFKIKAEITNK